MENIIRLISKNNLLKIVNNWGESATLNIQLRIKSGYFVLFQKKCIFKSYLQFINKMCNHDNIHKFIT